MRRRLSLCILVLSFYVPSSCNSTAVQLAQINPIGGSINNSGNYYLGYDIQGGITIAADKVTLNLNGHTIHSISIADHQDIAISNGIIDGSTLPNGGQAIRLSNATNIHLDNLTVSYNGSTSNLVRGIYITGGKNLYLSHLLIEGFSSTGCKVEQGSAPLFISDCVFSKNGSAPDSVTTDRDRAGLFINSSSLLVTIERCVATGNRTDGFVVSGISNAPTAYFIECTSSENGLESGLKDTLSNGFHGYQQGATPFPGFFVAIRCVAEENAQHGFYTEANTKFLFDKCLASYNKAAGFLAAGDDSSIAQVKECTALGNNRCGFDNNGGSGPLSQPVAYVANYATANADDYCLNGSSHQGFPYQVIAYDDKLTQYWRNTQ